METSRLIVKNLPQKCTEEKLKELFSSCGEVTDIRLVRTRAGVSRKFGFVGFNSAQQAEAASKRLNKTYIGASRIEVEAAKPYGDQSLERPWSKYSRNQSKGEVKGQGSKEGVVMTEIGQAMKEYEELEDDPEFVEFMDVHSHKTKVKTWSNSTGPGEQGRGKSGDIDEKVHGKSGKGRGKSGDMEGGKSGDMDGKSGDVDGNGRGKSGDVDGTSDLDYLKTKIVKEDPKEDPQDSADSADNQDCADSADNQDCADDVSISGDKSQSDAVQTTPFTIKMLGLPFKAGSEHVHTFFHPLKVVAVRFTKDPQGRPSGRAYADFQSEKDLRQALKRNRDCILHRYIELFRDKVREDKDGHTCDEGAELKPWEVKVALGDGCEEMESVTESGRVFVRNLPFSTQEQELSDLFGKYGPLTEVTIPIDKTTHRATGMAFITYMLPEHAVKAYQELDGQIFQGRLLHLLPARARLSQQDKHPAQLSSFKKKKASSERSLAGSGHNWNSLFLGANAVVDVMADKYNADKSDILDSGSGISAAVRVALGETQIVRETREFLQRHGVNLEVFDLNKPQRSKDTIIVKNLPSATTSAEVVKLFAAFGPLVQVILPPAAISAVVEFAEANHAKQAFSKLAYTSFKHLPLYLEWAPVNTMCKSVQEDPVVPEEEEEQEDEEEVDVRTSSVFVKNLNFSTDEHSLKGLFSQVGEVRSVSIARKKDPKRPATPLSMGFGFVEYKSDDSAVKAVKQLQHHKLEGHVLELKLSHHRTKMQTQQVSRKTSRVSKQKSAKILVRNIPFEASRRELMELFSTFGILKMVRLPKKLSAGGAGGGRAEHRGFGFVEFVSKEDAKSAFDALSHSTHFYGRRLVLEWAEQEESLEAIRKRTAQHFHGFTDPKKPKSQEQLLLSTLEKNT